MQIPRFTSSKPSEFAFASDEKSIRRPTASFVRCHLKNRRAGNPARRSRLSKTHGELERAEALSNLNRARRRVRRVRGDFCGGKFHFPEKKSSPCSFCARKSERSQQKLVGVCLHSYNDTVSANATVIIERWVRRFSLFGGVQILDSVYMRSS